MNNGKSPCGCAKGSKAGVNIFPFVGCIERNGGKIDIGILLFPQKRNYFLENNPFCGQRYEGELMELLSKMDMIYLDKYKDNIQHILSKALIENKTYEWICEEEREEFGEVINSFQIKLVAR